MKIATSYDKKGEDYNLRHDIQTIREALNALQDIMELASRTSDPTVTASSGKVYIWYRTDLDEIRVDNNGTVMKIALSAA